MKKEIAITEGSGNVFKDIGCSNPEEELEKAQILWQINDIIVRYPGQCMHFSCDDLNALQNGILTNFSLKRLKYILSNLKEECDLR